jgi:hypothetical protein
MMESVFERAKQHAAATSVETVVSWVYTPALTSS